MHILERRCDICGEIHWTDKRLRIIEEVAAKANCKSIMSQARVTLARIKILERRLGW